MKTAKCLKGLVASLTNAVLSTHGDVFIVSRWDMLLEIVLCGPEAGNKHTTALHESYGKTVSVDVRAAEADP